MKLIAGEWEQYKDTVIPPNAPAHIVSILRKTFYAGASVLFVRLLMELDPEKGATEKDLKMFDDLNAEVMAFAEEVGQ